MTASSVLGAAPARTGAERALGSAGHPVVRVDGVEKVTGAAIYSVDTGFPGTLFGAVVRSDRAHATVVEVDGALACGRRGVHRVVTFADLEGVDPYYGHHRRDHPVLAPGVVRFWGEPVAVVIAESRAVAEAAAREVVVSYEDLDPVMTVEKAMSPGAPLVHQDAPPTGTPIGPAFAGEQGTNEAFTSDLGWGDVEAAMAEAAEVVTTRSHIPALYPYAMEPFSAHARFVGTALEVISPAQHPFQVQRSLARIFDLPLSSVRVQVPYIGGGYGSRSYAKLEPLVAACSWVMDGRPVAIHFDVEGSIYTSRSDEAWVTVKSGFDPTGRLLARDIEVVLNTGVYAENSPQILKRCATRCMGPYRVPALNVEARAVYTTTAPADSYRGLGTYHTNVACEANLDQAAERVGISPFEIRRRNLLRRGEVVVPGLRPLDADLVENLGLVEQALVRRASTPSTRYGVGVACTASNAGASPVSSAIVRMGVDGSVIVLTGSSEIGQGSRTVLAQIAATELGVDLSRISVKQSDTHGSPYEWSTGASRTTVVVGLSVQRACQDLITKLLTMAAESWGPPDQDWKWDGNLARPLEGSPRTPQEVIAAWFGPNRGEVIGVGNTRQKNDIDPLPPFWELGMIGVEVAVDVDTGTITVEKLVSLADIGKAINPTTVKGQEIGAATQGLGAALFEELVYDGPQIVNSNMIEYRVPRTTDVPQTIETITVERQDGPGPYGSKGMGEGALTPVASAITAAVADATGTWFETTPITPEAAWHAMNEPESDQTRPDVLREEPVR
jgi:CO/xanthine dehydrogenase Mo-binding subunit